MAENTSNLDRMIENKKKLRKKHERELEELRKRYLADVDRILKRMNIAEGQLSAFESKKESIA